MFYEAQTEIELHIPYEDSKLIIRPKESFRVVKVIDYGREVWVDIEVTREERTISHCMPFGILNKFCKTKKSKKKLFSFK